MYSRTTDDYDAMSKTGIEVIVQPSFWLGSPRTSVGTFEDYWEHMISFETKRAKEFGIEHFVCISVNPKEANERPLALHALQAMTKYLDRESRCCGRVRLQSDKRLRRRDILKTDGYC